MNGTENIDISIPALKKAMKVSDYIALHRKTIEDRNLDRIRRNELNDALRKFETFLLKFETINPTEETMSAFINDLRAKSPSRYNVFANKYESLIRTNHNLISGIQRELICQRDYKKASRVSSYTQQTQDLFDEILRDGRKVKVVNGQPVINTETLAPDTRKCNVESARTILKVIKTNDILAIGSEAVEFFISEHAKLGKTRDQSNHLLAQTKPLFKYLWAKGLIKESPVANIIKPKRTNDDYVEQAGIDKLMDLHSLDWNDFFEVRDRFIIVCLYYDFALRKSEASKLDANDIRFSDFLELNLRAEVQSKTALSKKAKQDILMRNFFPESLALAKRYIDLRVKQNPTTGALLLSAQGNGRLGTAGCCDAVQKVCKQLGVKTHKDKTPAPHRLRHSMATLNIRPLGIRLEVRQIQKRMRHKSILTTEQVYVANNPLIDKAEHEAWAEEQERWNGNGHTVVQAQTEIPDEDVYISEDETIRKVRPLGITATSLKEFAKKQGKINRAGEYSERFIIDLATNYYTKDEAMGLLKYKKSGFFYWVKNKGIEQVFIGRVMLVKKDEVMKKVRGE